LLLGRGVYEKRSLLKYLASVSILVRAEGASEKGGLRVLFSREANRKRQRSDAFTKRPLSLSCSQTCFLLDVQHHGMPASRLFTLTARRKVGWCVLVRSQPQVAQAQERVSTAVGELKPTPDSPTKSPTRPWMASAKTIIGAVGTRPRLQSSTTPHLMSSRRLGRQWLELWWTVLVKAYRL
jgi:hypothetical protein